MTGKKVKKKTEKKNPKPITVKPGRQVRKCSLLRAVIVAILITVIAQGIHMLEAALTMDYYLDAAYMDVWSKVMMPEPGPPPIEFTYMSVLFGFVTALIYIWAYKLVEPSLLMLKWVKRGLLFGALLFLVGTVPTMLMLYLMVNLPTALIGWWGLGGLVIALIDGLLISKLC